MNCNFILQLIFSFTIFLGASRINNTTKQYAVTIPAQSALPQLTGNRQHDASSVWLMLSSLTESGTPGHHDHDDTRVHCLYFDRIRRRECGFSARCAFVKLLLVVVHLSLLLLMLCQVFHPVV